MSSNNTDQSKPITLNTPQYFSYCAFGGLLSCGVTHTLVTPLDLAKCRIQADPAKYKSLVQTLRLTAKETGLFSVTKGYLPTFIGYSAQGIGKFGLYEVFKEFYGSKFSKEDAYKYRTALYLASSASAEFFADILLCPMETIKVKMQTNSLYPSSFRQSFQKLVAEEGTGALMQRKTLIPLWGRQIPYTMMKFACFERTVEAVYKYILNERRENASKQTQLLSTVFSGYVAGIMCAIVSNPADVFVSVMNKEKSRSASDILKEIGFRGLWKGMGTRILMIGTLTSAQWFIYDGWKALNGLPSHQYKAPE